MWWEGRAGLVSTEGCEGRERGKARWAGARARTAGATWASRPCRTTTNMVDGWNPHTRDRVSNCRPGELQGRTRMKYSPALATRAVERSSCFAYRAGKRRVVYPGGQEPHIFGNGGTLGGWRERRVVRVAQEDRGSAMCTPIDATSCCCSQTITFYGQGGVAELHSYIITSKMRHGRRA